MKRISAITVVAISSILVSSPVFAEDATPTPTATPTITATPTATPSACQSLQACVDAAVPTAIASCAASNSSCTDSNTDKLAISAGILATRAIDAQKCSKAKTKFTCNACYQQAKLSLAFRFDGKLFHGLLAQAAKLIEKQRSTTCSALGNSNSGSGSGNGGNGNKGGGGRFRDR